MRKGRDLTYWNVVHFYLYIIKEKGVTLSCHRQWMEQRWYMCLVIIESMTFQSRDAGRSSYSWSIFSVFCCQNYVGLFDIVFFSCPSFHSLSLSVPSLLLSLSSLWKRKHNHSRSFSLIDLEFKKVPIFSLNWSVLQFFPSRPSVFLIPSLPFLCRLYWKRKRAMTIYFRLPPAKKALDWSERKWRKKKE